MALGRYLVRLETNMYIGFEHTGVDPWFKAYRFAFQK